VENVAQLVKSKKPAKGESVASECNGILVMNWRDKREVYNADTNSKGPQNFKTKMYY
jgi:hypothetical protein